MTEKVGRRELRSENERGRGVVQKVRRDAQLMLLYVNIKKRTAVITTC